MLRVAAALFAIVLVTPVSAQKPTAGAAAKALQGTWVFQTLNGQPPGDGSTELSLTFSGSNYHQTFGGKVNERGTFKVDASKKPMTIDLAIVEGPDAGKAQLGIIEVTGDTLTAHFGQAGEKTRPADMKPTAGTLLLVAKKKKA